MFRLPSAHAAELRKKYYTRKNAFSYIDGLYLAKGIAEAVDLAISTDPHLLGVSELKVILPSVPINPRKVLFA